MKSLHAITLFACVLLVSGCASMWSDPLRAAYDSGEISKEEYEARELEQEEALARSAPAYWELQYTISENRSSLPPD